MNLIEKATIIRYHRQRIAEFENGTVKVLGWKAEESQQKRFEVIASAADFNNSTLLDVGCGYGDLKAYLDQKFSEFTYIGIDQMPEFILKSKEKYAEAANTHFIQADFTTVGLPGVDYVIASGALGYRSTDPDFYFRMIRKMYEVANKAFIFNMLDEACFPQHPLLGGHNFEKVVSFCKTLSPQVTSLRGYADDDFTVFMYP